MLTAIKWGLNGLIVIDDKGNERDISVPGVFVFVGMNVNNAILKQEDGSFLCDMDDNGNVVVDLSMNTSLKGCLPRAIFVLKHQNKLCVLREMVQQQVFKH